MDILKKALRKMSIVALATSLYAPISQAQTIEINPGYNALEVAVTADQDLRTRLLTNVDIEIDNVTMGYHGLNEMSNLDIDTYFGKHVFTAGAKDYGTKLAGIFKTVNGDIIDEKIGLRNTDFVAKLGGYGSIDAVIDNNSANLTAFFGESLGNGLSAELYLATEIPFNAKATSYTEIQLYKALGDNFSVFARGEFNQLSIDDATYIVGLAKLF